MALAGTLLPQHTWAAARRPAQFNVRDFGAKGDGKSLDSIPIQKTIDACSQGGGGEVLVPAGRYHCGTILLKDGVQLRLEKEAFIIGSQNLDDYQNPDLFVDAVGQERGWCLIGIIDVTHVAIIGEGTIDGSGKAFEGRRPFLIRCIRSEDVRLEGVKLRDSAAWVTHLFQSKRVTITGIDIFSHANRNNDGIDVDSTSDVLIENCKIDTGDDAVCIKATSPLPTQNVMVRNCQLKSDWGAFKMGTESMGDFKDITVSDCEVHNTNGGAIKILSVDGARIERLKIQNITVTNSDMPIFFRLGERLNQYREPEARTTGHIKDVLISGIHCQTSATGRLDAPTAIVMLGEKTASTIHAIENVQIKDVTIELEGGSQVSEVEFGSIPERTRRNNYPEYIFFFEPEAPLVFPAYGIYARHLNQVTFEQVKITTRKPDQRPLVVLNNAHDITLDVETNPGNGPLIKTRDSTNIAQVDSA